MSMRNFGTLLALVFVCGAAHAQGRAPLLRAELDEHELRVYAGRTLFTAYKFGPDLKYPYFYPVNGPVSGDSVTTESSEPYPHHRSLFLACDKVNGNNYWQEGLEQGQIRSEGPVLRERFGVRVVFTDTCIWQRPGSELDIREFRRITIMAPSADVRIIDHESTFVPVRDVEIEQTNHAFFAARMVPELSVTGGGTLVDAHGRSGEAATFGKPAPWCDYYGTRNGVTEGLAILDHPENPWHPSPWFTRDYGFFSPTPMNWLEQPLRWEKDRPVAVRHRVIVHAGDTEAADIANHFKAYAGLPVRSVDHE